MHTILQRCGEILKIQGKSTKAEKQEKKKNQQETQGSPTDTHRGRHAFISCLDGRHSSSTGGQKATAAAAGMTLLYVCVCMCALITALPTRCCTQQQQSFTAQARNEDWNENELEESKEKTMTAALIRTESCDQALRNNHRNSC